MYVIQDVIAVIAHCSHTMSIYIYNVYIYVYVCVYVYIYILRSLLLLFEHSIDWVETRYETFTI